MLDVHIIRMGVFISGFDKMLFVKIWADTRRKKNQRNNKERKKNLANQKTIKFSQIL